MNFLPAEAMAFIDHHRLCWVMKILIIGPYKALSNALKTGII
jgi:hypothetical protein